MNTPDSSLIIPGQSQSVECKAAELVQLCAEIRAKGGCVRVLEVLKRNRYRLTWGVMAKPRTEGA